MNYPPGANTADAPWNLPDADMNDDLPKTFTVQVELIIRADNELEMEEALCGVIQGGVVDMDNQKILEWRYK